MSALSVATIFLCSQASSFFGIFLESFHVADCDTSHIDWSGCHLPTPAPDALLVQQYGAPLQLFWSFCLLLAGCDLLPVRLPISSGSPDTQTGHASGSLFSFSSIHRNCKNALLPYLSFSLYITKAPMREWTLYILWEVFLNVFYTFFDDTIIPQSTMK